MKKAVLLLIIVSSAFVLAGCYQVFNQPSVGSDLIKYCRTDDPSSLAGYTEVGPNRYEINQPEEPKRHAILAKNAYGCIMSNDREIGSRPLSGLDDDTFNDSAVENIKQSIDYVFHTFRKGTEHEDLDATHYFYLSDDVTSRLVWSRLLHDGTSPWYTKVKLELFYGSNYMHSTERESGMSFFEYMEQNKRMPDYQSKVNNLRQDLEELEREHVARQEQIRKERERQENKKRRRQQKNSDQLFGAIAAVAMGVAMDNAGASADQVVKASLAMHQDVSNNTTSNMQGLIDQNNKENTLVYQRQVAENQQFLQDNNQAYENTMAQQQAMTNAFNNCVANGGMWNNNQCYMPTIVQRQQPNKSTSAVASNQISPQQKSYNKQRAAYNQKQKDECSRRGGFVWDDAKGCVMRAQSTSYASSSSGFGAGNNNPLDEPYGNNNTDSTWSGKSSSSVQACEEGVNFFRCECKAACVGIASDDLTHDSDHIVTACEYGCHLGDTLFLWGIGRPGAPMDCERGDKNIIQRCTKELDGTFAGYCRDGYENYKSMAKCWDPINKVRY